jgi:hypothetical protein
VPDPVDDDRRHVGCDLSERAGCEFTRAAADREHGHFELLGGQLADLLAFAE